MAAVTTMNGYSLLGVPLNIIAAGGHSTQVRTGEVATILEYVAQRFHAEVEPLVTFHGWRSVATNEAVGGHPRSNHPSGTALDLNGYKHPYRATTTGFTPAQVVAIRHILAEVAPVVRWGGDFPAALRDGMHFEIVGTRAMVAIVAARISRPALIAQTTPATHTPEDDMFNDEDRAALAKIMGDSGRGREILNDIETIIREGMAAAIAANEHVHRTIGVRSPVADQTDIGMVLAVKAAGGQAIDYALLAKAVADEQSRRLAS